MTGKAQNAVGTVAALGVGAAVKKAVEATWRLGSGRRPPEDLTDPEIDIREALLLAVLTGAMAAVVRLLVARRLEQRARRKAARRAVGR